MNRGIPAIKEEKCIGCGKCVRFCPFDAIETKNGKAVITKESCRGCMRCVMSCPTEAIRRF